LIFLTFKNQKKKKKKKNENMFSVQQLFKLPMRTKNVYGVRCLSSATTQTSTQTQSTKTTKRVDDYTLPHPKWSDEELASIKVEHREPENLQDRLAHWTVRLIRFNFDFVTGYKRGVPTDAAYLRRCVFLESIAGCPGFVAAVCRHCASLAFLKRDHQWIRTLLGEAENERMHLLTFLKVLKPSPVMRAMVMCSQFIFWNFFLVCYIASPKFAHRLVGYIEEEAVSTYTSMVADVDAGRVFADVPAPNIAKRYWRLRDDATFRDVLLNVRADEAHHREVNHVFASLDKDAPNPFPVGY
jgi:Alternative oxidase